MKILLDTHTFLWFVNDSVQLSLEAKSLLESEVDLYLSIASFWEIAIKVRTGKMTLPKPFDEYLPQQIQLNEIEVLQIDLRHLNVITTLPLHHRDPFDRLLIAQVMVEQATIVSADVAFDQYGIHRSW
jgi:PIN domain nuclease of toxin-antitoxin system